jgi:phosphoribosylformimino-5-aminoimidazole carboxamide ribotide isomerase
MTELLRAWHGWPARGLVYTDTTRDGMLLGPNLGGLQTCVETYAGPVFLSGGVSDLDDIAACADSGAAGVVIGRALYEGAIDLAEALRAFPAPA